MQKLRAQAFRTKFVSIITSLFTIALLVLVTTGQVSAQSVSNNYQLNAYLSDVGTSNSNSYSLCAGLQNMSHKGDSPLYSLRTQLSCEGVSVVATPPPPTGGGGGRIQRRTCGNGILEFGEQCDDGNLDNGDGCSDFCTIEVIVSPGGGGGGGGSSNPVVCGNFRVEFGEQCDDGNTLPGDGCNAQCQTEDFHAAAPICGNNQVEEGELCDEADLSDGGFCTADCRALTYCGDGVVQELNGELQLEYCDDGNGINDDECNNACQVPGEDLVEDQLPSVTSVESPQKPKKPFSIFSATERQQDFQQEEEQVEFPEELIPSVVLDSPNTKPSSFTRQVFRGAAPLLLTEEPKEGLGAEYLTNDITTLFYEQFYGLSSDYRVELSDAHKTYDIKTIKTPENYFGFLVEEELEDGFYSIFVQDINNPKLVERLSLEVNKQEFIKPPQELHLSGIALDGNRELYDVFNTKPVLTGKTDQQAMVALYSEQLEEIMVAFTQEDNSFEIQYEGDLEKGIEETLYMVAHYENGRVSSEEIIRFIVQDSKQAAPDLKLVENNFLEIVLTLIIIISSYSAVRLYLSVPMGVIKSFTVSWPRILAPIILIGAGILFAFTLLWFNVVSAATTTPNISLYEGVLRDNTGTPVTTAQDFRFSIWNTADFDVNTHLDASGAIPVAAPGFSGFIEEYNITPDSNGFFQVELGSQTSIPDFIITRDLFLQVEVKPSGAPSTSYELLDVDGVDNVFDRQRIGTTPYSRNADFIDNRELGTSEGNIVILGLGDVFPLSTIPGGTLADAFELDDDGSAAAGVVNLSFGDQLLNRILSFDANGVAPNDGWFNFSDDVNIQGDLTVNGTINGVNVGPGNTTLQFQPEYPGASFHKASTNGHLGRMNLIFEDDDGNGQPDNFNLYEWGTRQSTLQDIDIVLRVRLADSFTGFQSNSLVLRYKTQTANVADNALDILVEDSTGTDISALLLGNTNLVNTQFTQATLDFTGVGTFTPGTELTLRIRPKATAAGRVFISDLNLNLVQ